ncbi:substrate-binding domain-containing protein [Murimonas intestini]|uniref:Monosaccharide ABC transporter substrate-binding protein (CUT2 family) n=1 Tax=Murimonas intestini TaxID=1337051 RepID=A0AB73T122_9FIRM|nr:substrate-binding domain-containing protein [Murimonas intestini]MCR1840352.1 substrate-binding domain-containing protein [Murimonas intestini]MCR1867537.1 substrate-binding domain-containing protein [Murimonas intestini]MCR1884724.1 substrate-binding domain-containing protein [Murimonas intestini]
MKKMLAVTTALALTASMGMTAFAAEAELPSADVAEEGYDFYKDAVSYNDLREDLGKVPKLDKEITIGFATKTFENEFWRMEKDGAEAAGKAFQDAGYKLTMDVRGAQTETDEEGQLTLLMDMVNKKYDAILVSGISEANLVPGMEAAIEAGIDLTTVMDAFTPYATTTVGAWHYQAGVQGAEWIYNKIGKEGKVACITGLSQATAAQARTKGFNDFFEDKDKIEVVAVQNGDWDRQKAYDITETLLQQYPDLAGIYCNNDTMAMGALEAVVASDSECVIVGTDGTSEATESIKAGELDATVDFFPNKMAEIAVEMQIRKLAGEELPKVIYAPQSIRDKDNVDKSFEEIFGYDYSPEFE